MAFFDPTTDSERQDYKEDIAIIRTLGSDTANISAWDAYMFVPSIERDPEVWRRLIAGCPYLNEAPAVIPCYALMNVLRNMTHEEKAALRVRLGKP